MHKCMVYRHLLLTVFPQDGLLGGRSGHGAPQNRRPSENIGSSLCRTTSGAHLLPCNAERVLPIYPFAQVHPPRGYDSADKFLDGPHPVRWPQGRDKGVGARSHRCPPVPDVRPDRPPRGFVHYAAGDANQPRRRRAFDRVLRDRVGCYLHLFLDSGRQSTRRYLDIDGHQAVPHGRQKRPSCLRMTQC